MDLYGRYLKEYSLPVGQVLISARDLSGRSSYVNARNTTLALLEMGVVPIFNENDTVAVEEIKFGDNDTLSALVAGLINADLLIVLSDVAGVYTEDPKRNPKAKILHLVDRIDEALEYAAKNTKVEDRIGGMKTKITATKIAARSGIPTIIGGGADFLHDLFLGKNVGTFLRSDLRPLAARTKWIAYGMKIAGSIVIDDGAKRVVMKEGRSLLPVGVREVRGRFKRGDCVRILDSNGKEFARGIVGYSSQNLELVRGLHTSEIKKKMQLKHPDEAIHRDNLAIVEIRALSS